MKTPFAGFWIRLLSLFIDSGLLMLLWFLALNVSVRSYSSAKS